LYPPAPAPQFDLTLDAHNSLVCLQVSCNRLTELPLDFGVLLPLLTDLHIHDNLLTSLPDSIALLSNLRVLDAHNNQLSVLPDAITECHELRWVLLGGNVLTSK
jgi:Leucine-rich repeat (LRR) protein